MAIKTVNDIKRVFNDCTKLFHLYNLSYGECQRNGKITMEIGSHRENDLKAFLVYKLGSRVNYKIGNSLEEDLTVDQKKISIKHITGIPGKIGFKIKWTADNKKVEECLGQFLNNNYKPPNYILVFFEKSAVTIQFIRSKIIKQGLCLFGKNAFKQAIGTNNRGIMFSREMLSYIHNNASFCITKPFKHTVNIDPVEKRLLFLKASHE